MSVANIDPLTRSRVQSIRPYHGLRLWMMALGLGAAFAAVIPLLLMLRGELHGSSVLVLAACGFALGAFVVLLVMVLGAKQGNPHVFPAIKEAIRSRDVPLLAAAAESGTEPVRFAATEALVTLAVSDSTLVPAARQALDRLQSTVKGVKALRLAGIGARLPS